MECNSSVTEENVIVPFFVEKESDGTRSYLWVGCGFSLILVSLEFCRDLIYSTTSTAKLIYGTQHITFS